MAKETQIVSKVTKNACQDSQLYNFVSDFRNIGLMLPPEVKEKVSFSANHITVQAVANQSVTLIKVEEEPHKLLKLGAEGARELTIWIQFKQVAPYDTRIRVTMHLQIPMVAKMFGKKKLQQFADGLAEAFAQIPAMAFQANNFN